GGGWVGAMVGGREGNLNGGEATEAVAQYLKSRRVPVESIGTGDPSDPVNVRVVEVTAPRMVFKSDPYQVTAFIAAAGLGDRPVDVQLRRAGESSVVERRTVRPRPDGQFDPVV